MGIPFHGVFAVRKKTRIIVAVLVFMTLGGALVWLVLNQFFPAETAFQQPATQTKIGALPSKIAAEVAKDSDNDGLKDWEEAIWRTDPNNPDTDSDKTPDGEEISRNRDPLKKGPNDKYAVKSEIGREESDEGKPSPQNLTAQLSARISSDVVGSTALGNQPDVESLANAYAEGLSGVAVLESAQRFSLRDLTPAPQSDLAAVLKFFAAIEEVWTKNFTPGQETDLGIFFNAFENQKEDAIAAKLEKYITGYRQAIESVKTAPAPKELQSFAVDFLNYLSKIKLSAELMQNFKSDPLAAMLAIRERLALNQEFDAFIKKEIAASQDIVKKKVDELAAAQKKP